MHIAEPTPPPTTAYGHVKRFLERFGHMMSRIILSVLYLLLVAPAGIFYVLFLDPLRMKNRPASNWVPFKSSNSTVDAARRQA
jgi:hypothetical protein